LKIHHLHIVRGTALAAEYARRPFPVLGYEEYLDLLCDFVERLDPNIVIERMFGEAPLGLLVAPNWHRTKNDLVLDIKRKFEEREELPAFERREPLKSACRWTGFVLVPEYRFDVCERSAVVHQTAARSEAPQRGGAHFSARGYGAILNDAVARSDIVQKVIAE